MAKLTKPKSAPARGSGGFGDSRPRPNMRVGGYARVSTGDQEDSVPVQDEAIRHWTRSCKGKLVAIDSDISSGRRSKKRRGYQDHKVRIRNKELDCIVTRDTSRWSRHPAELSNLFDLCAENSVEMWDMQIGRLTELHIWCIGLMAKMQVTTGVGQIHLALLSKSHAGLRAGGRIYGYRCIEVNGVRGHVVIDEKDQAPVVRMIYDWADKDKLSPRAIARLLNRRGILSPRGGKWQRKTVQYILHNPFYCADVRWNLTRNEWGVESEAYTKKSRDESEHVRIPGKQKAIITRLQWERVQVIRQRPAAPHAGRKPGPPTFLSGRLKCPVCGGGMAVCGGDGKKLRIKCGHNIQGQCENHRTFYRQHVLETCLTGLDELLSTPAAVELYLEEHNESSAEFVENHFKDRARDEKDISKLEREIDRLVDAVANGSDPAIFNERIHKRKEKLSELKESVEKFDASAVEFRLSPPSVQSARAKIGRLLSQIQTDPSKIDPELSEQVEALIDHVVVTPNDGRRGFKVEVFGDLAQLVVGKSSFKAAPSNRNSSRPTDVRGSGTITIQKAAKTLVFSIFKRIFDPAPTRQLPARARPRHGSRARPARQAAMASTSVPAFRSKRKPRQGAKGSHRATHAKHFRDRR